MRSAVFGVAAAGLTAAVLAGCGGEERPLGPAEPGSEDTGQVEEYEPLLPADNLAEPPSTRPGEPSLPGSEPGEIPEILRERPADPVPFDYDAPDDDRDGPERSIEDPGEESGAPL